MVPNPTGSSAEYSLLDYLDIARKRWPWMVLPVVALTAAAVVWSVTRPPRYESTASVLLADTASQRTLDPSSQNTGFLSRELSNEISLAQSDVVEQLVEGELGLVPKVVISSESDADVIVFTASAATADEAARDANTWAAKYIEVKREEAVRDIRTATVSLQSRLEELRAERQQLRSPLDDLDDRISREEDPVIAASLQRQYDRLADDLRYELELVTGQAEATVASLTDLELQAELSAVGEARLVQVAAPPMSTSNPPLSRNVALGVTLGLLAGFGLALLAETRDNTIKSSGDVLAITDLPVLASIPAADKRQQHQLGIATHQDPEGVYADGYHKVRSSLEFASFETDLKTILVTSASASEGKSTTSSNLALAFSSVGKRTVLVDVDYRRARLHQIYGISQAPGLSDVVLYGADMASVAYSISEPGLDNLLVLPTGSVPPSPAAFVGTDGFLGTIDWIRGSSDVVILDAPPLLAVSDPHTMAKHVDAVVLTALAGRTTKSELLEVITVLSQVGANVIGVVLVGVEESETYGKYAYYRKAGTQAPSGQAREAQLWRSSSPDRLIDLDHPAAHDDGAPVGPRR